MGSENRPRRGAPAKVKIEILYKALESNVNDIFTKDGGVVPVTNAVWEKVAKKTDNKIKPNSIHAYIHNDTNGLRSKLHFLKFKTPFIREKQSTVEACSFKNSKPVEIAEEEAENIQDLSIPRRFTLAADYLKSLTETIEKKNGKRISTVLQFKSGVYQRPISGELWQLGYKCAVMFSEKYTDKDVTSGRFKGYCHCGSQFLIEFNRKKDDNTVHFTVSVTHTGTLSQPCGFRPCTAAEKDEIAKVMINEKKTAVQMKTDTVSKHMKWGDRVPPFAYNYGVYNNAKCAMVSKTKGDTDPVQSIRPLHRVEGPEGSGSIFKKLNAFPFSLNYWTTHQGHVGKEIARAGHMKFEYDAMGRLFQQFDHPNGVPCGPLFLYSAVSIFASKIVPIFQWITEAHRSADIAAEMLFFHSESGVPFPKEVVCDEALGILNAAAIVYTEYKSAKRYADGIYDILMKRRADSEIQIKAPACYLRIDGRHFIMTIQRHLKSKSALPDAITFFLASIGHLMTRTNLDEAAKILFCIFGVASSRYTGTLTNGKSSLSAGCEKYLRNQITSDESSELPTEIEEEAKDRPEYNSAYELNDSLRKWVAWAYLLLKRCLGLLEKQEPFVNRQNINPFFVESLPAKLVDEMDLFPLWSCICYCLFNYGTIPATTSEVENANHMVRQHVARKDECPMPVKTFAFRHGKYLDANAIMAKAAEIEEQERNVQDTAPMDDSLNLDHLLFGEDYCNVTDSNQKLHGKESDNSDCSVMKYTDDDIVDSLNEFENYDNKGKTVSKNPRPAKASLFHSANEQIKDVREEVKVCVTCKLESSGMHSCKNCGKFVHAIESCSIADGEGEGCGQRRVCNNCLSNKHSDFTDNQLCDESYKKDENESNDETGNSAKQTEESNYIVSQCATCGIDTAGFTKCDLCNVVVHGFITCSYQMEEDPDGIEKRRCHECFIGTIESECFTSQQHSPENPDNSSSENSDSKTDHSFNEVEEKQTLPGANLCDEFYEPKLVEMTDDAKVDTATKKLRKESVFFNNKLAVKERLQWKSAKGVPILKNGTYVKTPITIAGIKFSPTKTCPIDSLVQAILIAATDNKSVEEFIRLHSMLNCTFNMVELIMDSKNTGKLNLQPVYKTRLQVMIQYEKSQNNDLLKDAKKTDLTMTLDCATDVSELANYLFQGTPSLTGETLCYDDDCRQPRREIKLPTIKVSVWEMVNERVSFISNFLTYLEVEECANCHVRLGVEEIKFGKFLIFDSTYDHIMEGPVKLDIRLLPLTLDHANSKTIFKLVGLVGYRGVIGRKITGHFTALCLRGEKWIELDDVPHSSAQNPTCRSREVSKKDFVRCPALIIYTLCEK